MEKKAQEEMVGFVLIMLVVAVIFVVFLGIYLRQATNPDPIESQEIAQFLEAVFEYSTDCDGGTEYYRMEQLITECNDNPRFRCGGTSRPICDELTYTLQNMIEATWNISEQSQTKGYRVTVTQETVTGVVSVIDGSIAKGEFTRNIRAAQSSLPKGIELRLELYS